MARLETRQDSDRPHYYSQFWVDVAMGKQIGSPEAAVAETEDEDEDELAFTPKPEAKPKASKPVEKKPEPSRSTLTSLAELAQIDELMKSSADMNAAITPDATADIMTSEPPSVAGLDYNVETDAAASSPEGATARQDDDFADYQDEEDDEEDDDWGASRHRKPGKSRRRERTDTNY